MTTALNGDFYTPDFYEPDFFLQTQPEYNYVATGGLKVRGAARVSTTGRVDDTPPRKATITSGIDRSDPRPVRLFSGELIGNKPQIHRWKIVAGAMVPAITAKQL